MSDFDTLKLFAINYFKMMEMRVDLCNREPTKEHPCHVRYWHKFDSIKNRKDRWSNIDIYSDVFEDPNSYSPFYFLSFEERPTLIPYSDKNSDMIYPDINHILNDLEDNLLSKEDLLAMDGVLFTLTYGRFDSFYKDKEHLSLIKTFNSTVSELGIILD